MPFLRLFTARGALSALLAWGLVLAAPLAAPTTAEAPLRVMVSVVPVQTAVERVGGEHVVVESLVRPGDSPHTYEPSPRQMAALGEADLYVRLGMPFEQAWMGRITGANPDMRVVDARQGLELMEMPAHDHAPGHAHDPAGGTGSDETGHHHHEAHGHAGGDDPAGEALDPHVWTSPLAMRQISETIRDALSELAPAQAETFARNQADFAAELASLDTAIRARLTGLPHRAFLVFHPAWGYFARAYDLEQVPIEREGKEPGARGLAQVIERAREADIRAVFVQPQMDRRVAERIASAIGGRVIVIDPLAGDYIANLRRVAESLAEALSAQPAGHSPGESRP